MRTQAAESGPDPTARRDTAGGGRALPGPGLVGDQGRGRAQLGVSGDHHGDPPVGGFGREQPGSGQAEVDLGEPVEVPWWECLISGSSKIFVAEIDDLEGA